MTSRHVRPIPSHKHAGILIAHSTGLASSVHVTLQTTNDRLPQSELEQVRVLSFLHLTYVLRPPRPFSIHSSLRPLFSPN